MNTKILKTSKEINNPYNIIPLKEILKEKILYDNICNIHRTNYYKYCLTCQKDICNKCELDLHKKHQFMNYENLMPDLNELNIMNETIKDYEKCYNMFITIINNWKILKRDPNNSRNWIVECTCEAHTQKSMRIDEMKSSLGCPRCTTATNKLIDLVGKKFGHWTVLSKGEVRGCHIYWLCECDCENHTIKEIDGYALRSGKSTSCGCQHFSKGEEKIKELLKENNISFETQKTFKTCQTSPNNYAKFDFYINNQYIIEFDGEQHFKLVDIGWNDPEKLARTQERDAIKNQWCKENNIPLIRIPYTHLQDLCLEDLLLETSQFVVN